MKNKFSIESLKIKLCAIAMFLNLAACELGTSEQTEKPQETKTEIQNQEPKEPKCIETKKQETSQAKTVATKQAQQKAATPRSVSPVLDTVLVIEHNGSRYRNETYVCVVKKNGEEVYINGWNCSNSGKILTAERGDELVLKYIPATKKKEAEWQVVENLTANRLKDQWLQEQRQKGQH